MKILGIDTASSIASVAILDGDTVLAETQSSTKGHRADLLVLIDGACSGAGLTPSAIEAVAIGAGPGSFTGLRIGMATAKGIAFAAKRPLWAVSSLAALAQPELVVGRVVVGVLDARRGEVYVGAYRLQDGAIVAASEERVMPPDEVAAYGEATRRGGEAVLFVGDASYPELAELAAIWNRTPSGAAVARLALAGAHVDVLVGGVPSYIRPSEAEVKYPDGVPGALRKR